MKIIDHVHIRPNQWNELVLEWTEDGHLFTSKRVDRIDWNSQYIKPTIREIEDVIRFFQEELVRRTEEL